MAKKNVAIESCFNNSANVKLAVDELSKLVPSEPKPPRVHGLKEVDGPALKLLRLRAGMTQVIVVDMVAKEGIEITQGWLSKAESGAASVTTTQIAALCDVYGIDEMVFHSVVASLRRNRELSRSELKEAFSEELNLTKLPLGQSVSV